MSFVRGEVDENKAYAIKRGRDEEYRNKIIDLFTKSDEYNPDSPDVSKMTQEEIDQLEKLLWID